MVNAVAEGVPHTGGRPLPNGRGWLTVVRVDRYSEIRDLAREVGLAMQAKWALRDRAEDYHGGW